MFRAMISVVVVSVDLSSVQTAHADANIAIGKKFEGELALPQTRISNVDDFRVQRTIWGVGLKSAGMLVITGGCV